MDDHAIPAGLADAKVFRTEKLEDILEIKNDPEKGIAYRIAAADISIEQKKEEARIMSVTNSR